MDERERAKIRAAIDAAEGRGVTVDLRDDELRALLAGSRTIAVVGAVVLSRRPRDLEPIPEPESMTDMGDEPLTAIPEEGAH